MKPAPFDYYAPATMAEALDLLHAHGYGCKILAGGQSLVPTMNFRLAQPGIIVDINNLADLAYIRPGDDGGVRIGALTRDSVVEHDPLVAERAPMLSAVLPHVAFRQVRNRGTFGGTIAHADPAGQMPTLAVALEARCLIHNVNGKRWVDADDFFTGFYATVLEPDDLLVEVRFPPLPRRGGWGYRQFERQEGSGALLGVAVVATLDDRGRCARARIVLMSVGERPVIATQAAAELAGRAPTPDAIAAAADLAATVDIDPGSDIHASAEFRRHLARNLTAQALAEAFERAARKGG